MASIKLYVKTKIPKRDGKVLIYLQVIHKRVVKYLPLDIYVNAASFDFKLMKCKPGHSNAGAYNIKLAEIMSKCELVLLDQAGNDLTPDELVQAFKERLSNKIKSGKVRPYVEGLILKRIAAGKNGTALSYSTALKQLENFRNCETFSDITYTFLNDFKEFKLKKGTKKSSIAAYFRAVRYWFNEAAREGLINKDLYPFKTGLMPGKQTTIKKNLDINVIQKLVEIRPTLIGLQRISVNVILLEFYLQGADFIEVIRLRKSDIKQGYITFTRYKNRDKDTIQTVKVKLLPQALEIINECLYDYFTPILMMDIESNYTLYKTRRSNIVRSLNGVCKRFSLSNFTTKSIRHTWASIAQSKGVSREIREVAMGHATPDMQGVYTNISQSDVDECNELVCG